VATSLEKTRKSLNVEKIIDPGLKSSGTLAQVLESPGISFQLCSDLRSADNILYLDN
jgi:hypothetical protein